jgi:hypothetical protein
VDSPCPARSGLSGLLRWCLPFDLILAIAVGSYTWSSQISFSSRIFLYLPVFCTKAPVRAHRTFSPRRPTFPADFSLWLRWLLFSLPAVFPLGIHRFSSILPVAALMCLFSVIHSSQRDSFCLRCPCRAALAATSAWVFVF